MGCCNMGGFYSRKFKTSEVHPSQVFKRKLKNLIFGVFVVAKYVANMFYY